MFENSNRYEERFMIRFVDDLQILLESEDKVPPRQIPENYQTKPLTMNIAFMKNEEEQKRRAGVFNNLKGLFKLEKTAKHEDVKKKKFDVLPYLKGLIFSVDSFGNSKDGEVEFSSDNFEQIELESLNSQRKSTRSSRKKGSRRSSRPNIQNSKSTLPKPSIINNMPPSQQSPKKNRRESLSNSRGTFKEDTQDNFSRFSKREEFRDVSSKDFRLLSVKSNLRNEKLDSFSEEELQSKRIVGFKSDEDVDKSKVLPVRIKTENGRSSKISGKFSSRFIRGSVSRRSLNRKNQ
jgi:hypothetical protein